MITERKLRQIIKQELLNLLEARQPTEDLAIFYKLLDQLGTFHFAGDKEQQTMSFLNNEMIPTLDEIIRKIERITFTKIKESMMDTVRHYVGREKETPEVFTKTDLQITIQEVKNKLKELTNLILDKRTGFNKEYENYHNDSVLPILNQLKEKLEELIQSNTKYPSRSELTKRDTLKSLSRGQT